MIHYFSRLVIAEVLSSECHTNAYLIFILLFDQYRNEIEATLTKKVHAVFQIEFDLKF